MEPTTSILLLQFSTLLLLYVKISISIGDTSLCWSPLGMEDKRIPDQHISSSSFYVVSVGPHQARLNTEASGGAWCPKEPISHGVREWLQVSFNGTYLLSGIQIQGRFARGKGQEYAEEFELEYWRNEFSDWRRYYKFDGKTILPGNSDTSSIVTNKLRPPILGNKIRILPYSPHRRTVCLRIELFGCKWEDGVIEYNMPQGENYMEGISLRDSSYDGIGSQWDRNVDPFSSNPSKSPEDNNTNDVLIFHNDIRNKNDSVEKNTSLSKGLGQLTDKIIGGSAFTMDMGFGLGNGWVGWKKKKPEVESEYIEISVLFDTIRKFTSLDLYVNNYPSKGVQIPSLIRFGFSLSGINYNGKSVKVIPGPGLDLTLEHARNISLPLHGRIGKYIKIQLYFRDQWILVGEMYFQSEIYEGNLTEEEFRNSGTGAGTMEDFSESPLEIRDLDSSMMETVVGILCGIILLFCVSGCIILVIRKRNSSLHFESGFPFWRNPPWASVPTHIVTQDTRNTEGVKDLLLTLTPMSNGTNGTVHHHNSNGIYSNGGSTIKNHLNNTTGGSYNHYGATTNKVNENGGGTTITTNKRIRTNQLAALEEASRDLEENNEDESIHSNNSNTKNKNKKSKVSGSVWNLSCGSRFYYRKFPLRLVPEVSLRQLRLIENLGSCNYGQVHLYDFDGEISSGEGSLYRNCRLIAKTVKNLPEIRLLSILDHEHVLDLIGVSTDSQNIKLAIFPAPECGDLCSFLSRLTNTPSLSWLVNVGCQIASGMNYLESLSLTHRDLAARNCLVEREGLIRISDLSMACEQYGGDYCETENGLLPLRWWPWESIISDEFTLKGSVWSFGVTLWEILTLCRQKPLSHIQDHQLIHLAQKYGNNSNQQDFWLPQPVLSPPEIFDLMRECWQVNPDDRPTFQHIHLFLDSKTPNTIYQHSV